MEIKIDVEKIRDKLNISICELNTLKFAQKEYGDVKNTEIERVEKKIAEFQRLITIQNITK